MGSSKGGSTVQNYERPQSEQELALLETQNQQMLSGIAIADEQEKRSAALYDDWLKVGRPVMTGMIGANANRENGYIDGAVPDQIRTKIPKGEGQYIQQYEMTPNPAARPQSQVTQPQPIPLPVAPQSEQLPEVFIPQVSASPTKGA